MDSITIDGISTWDDLGLALVNEGGDPVEMNPPEARTTYVDLMGGGFLDLSDAYGDAAYGKREQTFEFLMKSKTKQGIEAEATKLMGLFHGQRCEYSLSWDKGYTYTGRWSIGEYENRGNFGTVRLSVVADPYKSAGTVTYKLEGGTSEVALEVTNGRKRVRPTIEVENTSTVDYMGTRWTLEAGAWTIDDLLLEPDTSTIIINTSPDLGERTVAYWSEYFIYDLADSRICDLTGRDSASGGDAYVSFERFYL